MRELVPQEESLEGEEKSAAYVKHELNRSKEIGVLAFTDYQETMHKRVVEDELHNILENPDRGLRTR